MLIRGYFTGFRLMVPGVLVLGESNIMGMDVNFETAIFYLAFTG